MKKKKLKILGVCQGQGALLFPLRKYLIGNIEPRGVFHTPKEEQWRLNFGEIPFVKTFEQLNYSKKVDIILGSPNCGHSSALSYSRKKTLGNPKEDKSLQMFIDSIKIYQPNVFLMENLPKLLSLMEKEAWEYLWPNYDLIFHCHSVAEFGNSQKSRKRLLIIGVKKGSTRELFNSFGLVFKVREIKTLGELLCSLKLDDKLNINIPLNNKLAMYDYRDKSKSTLTVKGVQKLWTTDFKDEYKWPIKSSKMSTLPGVYRNHQDKYPMTVRPSSRQFNPSGYPITLAEYKIIQGFPKNFKVFLDEDRLTYWLQKGRISLTKGPSYEIGLWFKKCLFSNF